MTSKHIAPWIREARARWQFRGNTRPPFADEPGPGQESVWDYPRPPSLTREPGHITVSVGDVAIASTTSALKLAETASAPTYYIPRDDIHFEHLRDAGPGSFCEWKGRASYYDVVAAGRHLQGAAWHYPDPLPGFELLVDHLAFYPTLLDCRLDGEQARPQPGGLYGGWVTNSLAGPIKGERDTNWW